MRSLPFLWFEIPEQTRSTRCKRGTPPSLFPERADTQPPRRLRNFTQRHSRRTRGTLLKGLVETSGLVSSPIRVGEPRWGRPLGWWGRRGRSFGRREAPRFCQRGLDDWFRCVMSGLDDLVEDG